MNNRSLRAVICEDEPLARRALREYLADTAWIEIVDEAANGRDALRLIHKHEPDLVFMDVRMPGLTGLEVVDAMSHRAAIVFTTAYDEYAVHAFDVGAVDYLVKPFGRDRLLATLERVRVRMLGEGLAGEGSPRNLSDPLSRVFARKGGAVVPVPVAEIVRATATVGGVALHCVGGEYELDCTLAELEQRLDPADFVRAHRSHVINLEHVRSITRYDERRLEIALTDGSSLVASRQGSRTLRDAMEG